MLHLMTLAENISTDPMGIVGGVGITIEVYMLFQLNGYVKDVAKSLSLQQLDITKILYELSRNYNDR